jgi:exosortase/archaeosortase family protein
MTTQLAAAVLRCGSLEVAAQGTVLTWRGERVLIDAPCSGVHMLWTLLCVGALLATVSHAGPRETLRLFRRASLLVLVANTLRAAALFCVELRLWPSPPWAHDAIGLTLFGAAAAALVAWTMRRDREDSNAEHVPVRAAFQPRVASSRIRSAWVLTCGACAVWPVLVDPGAARSRPVHTKDFPGWAAAPLPAHLHGVPLGPSEKRFAENFPGAIGAFRDDSQRTTWIVRWVAQPTRKLHPAIDCLRALGFSVEPGAGSQDAMGRLWGGASATKPGGQRLRVREQISDSRGRTWSDVSAWYWSAFWRQTEGPWWALTQLEES